MVVYAAGSENAHAWSAFLPTMFCTKSTPPAVAALSRWPPTAGRKGVPGRTSVSVAQALMPAATKEHTCEETACNLYSADLHRHCRARSAGEGGSAAAPREKRWALCSLRRRCPVPDAGAQINNSSAWPGMLPKVWPAIQYLHANTVEMPVYWNNSNRSRGSSTTRWSTRFSPRRASIASGWFCSVWHVEERQPALHAGMDEAGAGAVLHVIDKNGHAADSPSPYATPRSKRQAGLRRVYASPQSRRPAANGHHGAGGE